MLIQRSKNIFFHLADLSIDIVPVNWLYSVLSSDHYFGKEIKWLTVLEASRLISNVDLIHPKVLLKQAIFFPVTGNSGCTMLYFALSLIIKALSIPMREKNKTLL